MPRENLCVQVGNHHTLSYTCTTTVDHKDQIWVAAMKRQCIVHYTTWTPFFIIILLYQHLQTSMFLISYYRNGMILCYFSNLQ